jgi:hypothetical protein
MNPHEYLTELLESLEVPTTMDDESIWSDPTDSRPGGDVPNESGPIVYYPEDDPNYEPDQPELPNESGPIFYDPAPGSDDVIDGCWGSGSTHEVDPGEVSIQPVDELPTEDVFIEPEPEPEPGPVMSIQPVEETPVTFEADVVVA